MTFVGVWLFVFFFKQKTAYGWRISDWSSDVCSSDLLGRPAQLFAAEKVWTWLQSGGPGQMEEQRALWGVERFDLMQVHNLLSWEGQLETLKQWKGEGRLHYLGITTSHGSRHDEMEEVRSEEHTYELQSLMRISYAVFCLKK